MRVLFNTSEHVGHLNPTLPLVKALVEAGHDVHFLCLEIARQKIEDMGAVFHNTMDIQSELYSGRGLQDAHAQIPKLALFSIVEELGMEMSFLSLLKCLNVSLEMELPGTLRFLRKLQPDVLIYDPLFISRASPLAANVLGIPAVGLLTLAGPGAMCNHGPALLRPLSLDESGPLVQQFVPHMEATRRINEKYGLALKTTQLLPDGYLDTCLSNTVLVTTSEELQDPATEAARKAYEEDGTRFAFVGPLLLPPAPCTDPAVLRVREARAAGRLVVAVSMGTVITGGDQVAGWDADFDGQSISGRDLCRAVWGGTFEASGDALVVAALGWQPDALGDLQVPSDVLCVNSFAQVEVLRSGVDVFVTHGGQNSFTEALSCGTPVVVCPGFGDQEVNAAKAVRLGVGLKVDRPKIASAPASQAAAQYREDVRRAVQRLLAEGPAFRRAAQRHAEKLAQAGGVPRAVGVILKAAEEGLQWAVTAGGA
mmetsp:Transcript_56357/g.134536  ORF Transcript_56357/g.134536 Transcript_56357/m.134536 type:complete len:482 (+) Transcript_56357:70-1515(+)|eukprot:CAMPEP_0181424844 /NCGR_PEP_ID=MMETSP1110-20121109/14854_1 /TAXON_ID=174948 /ORGANISM="Symbiodinium sp., Strain CCMP421" /LENGTH=481 /DNA_ID=CAMNT_0023548015 /DNA_START=62 /DNA_END=1507 /DNA_ORIENTATION=+